MSCPAHYYCRTTTELRPEIVQSGFQDPRVWVLLALFAASAVIGIAWAIAYVKTHRNYNR